MKSLMYKEFKLSINIMAYFMPLLGALLLIPNWTYLIAFMYAFITIPVTFVICKDQRDLEFSVLLPVRKRDIVKARLYSVAIIELIQILVAVIFAIISNALYPHGNAWLLDINFAFFGLVFVIYSIFNFLFLTMFYKTANKIALPVLISLFASLIFAVGAEYLIQAIPAFNSYFDGVGAGKMVSQLPVLLVGILIFIGSLVAAYNISYKRFEKIDI